MLQNIRQFIKCVTLTLSISILLIYSSCKKLIEVDPPIDNVVGKEIYKSDRTAASVLTGILTELSKDKLFNLSLYIGMYGEELDFSGTRGGEMDKIYRNQLLGDEPLFWRTYYEIIFQTNAAIEGITESQTLSSKVKRQLLGEAKFVRALTYFYLVNIYGDVPLVTSTDPMVNRLLPRESEEKVYGQIVADLKEAQALLYSNYVGGDAFSPTGQRLRPNAATATALLARVYLYTQSWELAVQESTKVIADSRFKLESLEAVFLIESNESIWQLQPITNVINTSDARTFVLKAGDGISVPGPSGMDRPVYLSSNVYERFESNDLRKTFWTDTVHIVERETGKIQRIYPFANKYKNWKLYQPQTEYPAIFRLAEQYLIRAEAKGHLGRLQEAAEDLFVIRNRAGLSRVEFASEEQATEKILSERRSEFFTEFAHRWFDLKRTGNLDEQMSKIAPGKDASWSPYKALLPIPLEELRTNPNMNGKQNPGYIGN